jgi:2,4-dienoyl-CoA reductase-like NADH-dependent reductase (Old Yellow Enzyme family)
MMYQKLFTPYSINSMTLPNRLVLPAMVTRLSGEDEYVKKMRDRLKHIIPYIFPNSWERE